MPNNTTEVPGVSQAKDFKLESLLLIGASGKSVDLRSIMEEINVFEDIFSPCITGNILVTDSSNIINTLPITGHEYLLINFTKPSQHISFNKMFRLYKISDRKQSSDQNEVYILHFCSEEMVLNETMRISKIYTGKAIYQIIQDIAMRYLHINAKKFPETHLRSTTGTFDISIPNWTPFYAINWLSQKAYSSQYQGAAYVFFESRDGFHFISLEELVKKPPVQKLLNSKQRLGHETDILTPDLQSASESIAEYEYLSMVDVLGEISSGKFAGTLITVDPVRQRIATLEKNAEDVFSRSMHLNTNSLSSNANIRTRSSLGKAPRSYCRLYPTTLGHDTLQYARTGLHPNQVESWLLQRNMYLYGLNSNRMNVSVPGNVNLTVGDTVDVDLPAITAQSKKREFDQLYSGKYLITAVRHSINRKEHICYLEISKDSSEIKYPAALNDDPSFTAIKKI